MTAGPTSHSAAVEATKRGLSLPPARYVPPFNERSGLSNWDGCGSAHPHTRPRHVTRLLLFYNTGGIDLLFYDLRLVGVRPVPEVFTRSPSSATECPLGESRCRRRHAAVDFMLMIGLQGACHHGDWHASLPTFDAHVRHSQSAAGSRVEGTPGANAPTKRTRPQQHEGEEEEKNIYIRGIRADGEQKGRKQQLFVR